MDGFHSDLNAEYISFLLRYRIKSPNIILVRTRPNSEREELSIKQLLFSAGVHTTISRKSKTWVGLVVWIMAMAG